MNISHLKYAVEIEKTKSMNKAAENLFVGQPNLSRAIKELEESIGIKIFKRTSKGMTTTEKGEEFLLYAKSILKQIDNLETLYRTKERNKINFSISVPRASYISDSFLKFVNKIDTEKNIEIYYKETNAEQAIENLVENDYNLAVIRYQSSLEPYFTAMINEKHFKSENIWEFDYYAVMSSENKLAQKEQIYLMDLADEIEILQGDPCVPLMSESEIRKTGINSSKNRKIYIFDRASQFEILESVNNTYMWLSAVPENILKKYGLVQKKCSDLDKKYKDVLVYRKDYQFSEYDKIFMEQLCKSINEIENRSYCL
jgi:DNA-binding transcriptional LysR family regulator